jgi:hypothetical protein
MREAGKGNAKDFPCSGETINLGIAAPNATPGVILLPCAREFKAYVE